MCVFSWLCRIYELFKKVEIKVFFKINLENKVIGLFLVVCDL